MSAQGILQFQIHGDIYQEIIHRQYSWLVNLQERDFGEA